MASTADRDPARKSIDPVDQPSERPPPGTQDQDDQIFHPVIDPGYHHKVEVVVLRTLEHPVIPPDSPTVSLLQPLEAEAQPTPLKDDQEDLPDDLPDLKFIVRTNQALDRPNHPLRTIVQQLRTLPLLLRTLEVTK